MASFTSEELSEFYEIISNLITREQYDAAVTKDGSRKICKLLSEKAADMTFEQLKEITCGRWRDMFIEGIAHISWCNGCYHNLFHAFFREHGFKQNKYVEHQPDGSWFTNDIRWFTDGTYAVKEVYHSPVSFSSSCRSEYYYSIVDASEAPKDPTHIVTIIHVSDEGRIGICDQFAGTRDECELWADNYLYNYRGDRGYYTTRFFEFSK